MYRYRPNWYWEQVIFRQLRRRFSSPLPPSFFLTAANKRLCLQLGTTQLARQLRYEDDEEKPLVFYATASSLAMFQAVKKLIKETIGVAGLAEQLRHQCSQGTNVLMRACGDPEVFREVTHIPLGRGDICCSVFQAPDDACHNRDAPNYF